MTALRAVLLDRDETISTTDASVYRQAADWIAGQWHKNPAFVRDTLIRHWQNKSGDWWQLRTLDDEEVFWQEYGKELFHLLDIPGDQSGQLLRHYPYERYMKVVPGTRQVLQTLRQRGLKIGVLSNTLPSIEATLKQLGVHDLIDVALATCTLGVHKPQPEAFVLAAQALAVPPQAVLFLDDRLENVQAAREVGMQAHQIDLSGRNPEALHSLHDLLNLTAPTA